MQMGIDLDAVSAIDSVALAADMFHPWDISTKSAQLAWSGPPLQVGGGGLLLLLLPTSACCCCGSSSSLLLLILLLLVLLLQCCSLMMIQYLWLSLLPHGSPVSD